MTDNLVGEVHKLVMILSRFGFRSLEQDEDGRKDEKTTRRGQEVEEKNQSACKETALTKTRSYFFCYFFFQDTNDLHHLCLGLLELRKESSLQTELVMICGVCKGKELFLSRTLPNIPNKVITCSY